MLDEKKGDTIAERCRNIKRIFYVKIFDARAKAVR